MTTKGKNQKTVVFDDETIVMLDDLLKHELSTTHEKSNYSRIVRQLIRKEWKCIIGNASRQEPQGLDKWIAEQDEQSGGAV